MNAEERFSNAAYEFCTREAELRSIKAEIKHCSESEPASTDGVYPGSPPCDLDGDSERLCENCSLRLANGPRKALALRKRQQSKKKMMRWFGRLNA